MDQADIWPFILTALGSGGVVGGAVKLWTDLRSGRRDDFRALVETYRLEAQDAKREAKEAKKEARRAFRLIARVFRAARACPGATTCGVLALEMDFDDEGEDEDEAVLVGAGR